LYRLVTIIFAAAAIFCASTKADGLADCTTRELKLIVLKDEGSKGDRVREIKRQLSCLGRGANPFVAATASNEVAMHLVGGDRWACRLPRCNAIGHKVGRPRVKAGRCRSCKDGAARRRPLEYIGVSDTEQLRKA
jgi:hypothetical protein